MFALRSPFSSIPTLRIASIHFESLATRRLVLEPRWGARPCAETSVEIVLEHPRTGEVVRRRLPVVHREGKRVHVEITVRKHDWFSDELAFRSRKGDYVRFVPAPALGPNVVLAS